MFKYVTDLLFSEEREDVYDDDEKNPESESEDASESDSEEASESQSEEAGDSEGDETDSDSGSSDSGSSESGDPDWCGGHRCILSCDDLSALQEFVDSIREECIARQIALGGSRDVIRGKRKRAEMSSDGPLTPVCDTVPGMGCDPQDPIPCECSKPKEE